MKETKIVTVFFLLAAILLTLGVPVVVAQDGRVTTPALPFPGNVGSQGKGSPGMSPSSVGTSGIAGGANWLLTQQSGGGGFPWTVGGGIYANTQGPTAQGELKAYQHDGDSAYLASAVACGDYLVPNYPVTYSDGDPRFATHNPLFLEDLSLVTGVTTYADFVQTWFWDKLTSGTYGENNDWDAADFGAYVVNVRAAQGIVALSPWDLSATAIAAHVAGETAIRNALMAAIEDGLEATTAGDNYDVIGLAGAVWASAITGVDLDPTTGAYASASSTADLAVILSGMTLTANDGAWLWRSDVDPTDPTNGDTQTTAYALMALNAHDRSTYLGQIARGAAFIRSLQSSGQFLAWPGASPLVSGGVEGHAEALTALVVVAPSTVYVDDDWAALSWGDDPDGAGPAIAFGYDAFATIPDAIDGVGSSTIYVAPGTYDAQVVINIDGLKLIGPNAGIDPCTEARGAEAILKHTGGITAIGTASTVVFTNSNGSTLDGFTVQSTQTAVNQVAVLIGGNFVGDGTRPSDGNTVRNNIITGGRTCVYIWQSKDNDINHNEMIGPHESAVFVGDCDTSGDPSRSPTGNRISSNCIDKAGTGALGNGIQLAHTGCGSTTGNDYGSTVIELNEIKDTSGSSKLFRGIDTDEAYGLTGPIAINENTVEDAIENYGNGLNLKNSSNIEADGNVLDADNNRCVVATNVQGVTLTDNEITSDGASGGGWHIVGFSGGTSDVTMTGNTITVNDPARDGRVVYMVGVTGTVEIIENEITVTGTLGGSSGFYHGLDVFGASASTTFSISENTLINSAVTSGGPPPPLASVGIRLRSSLDPTVVMNVRTNIITGWANGIRSDDLASGIDVNVIDCNQIFLNSTYGLLNGTGAGESIDATGNWWGDPTGPSGAGTGSGDAVTTNVVFAPWGTDTGCAGLSFHNFALLATKKLDFDHNDKVEGNVHSNRDIDFDNGRPSTLVGSVTAVRDVEILRDNHITGSVTAGGSVDLHEDSDVDGGVTENAAVAVIPLPAFNFGPFSGSSVRVDDDDSETIPPDEYRVVRGGKDAVLKLSSGVYKMNSLVLDGEGKLLLDLSGGPIVINIDRRLVLRKDTEIKIKSGTGTSYGITINYDGRNPVVLGNNGKYRGTLIAPSARVVLGSDARYLGSICARRIDLRKDSRMAHHSFGPSLPKATLAVVNTTSETMPVDYALDQNYPNPFNPSTKITFVLPEASTVQLKIYDLMGNTVKTLVNGKESVGRHEVVWHGRNRAGESVAAGTYIYRMAVMGDNGETPVVITKKMTFLK